MNNRWKQEAQKFFHALADVQIPDSGLDDVDSVVITGDKDLETIPQGGGCYWIWTNEPIIHSLHENKVPVKLSDGEIIYNGIAKDDVRNRVRHHLLGKETATWSGISIDIYLKNSKSHRKKALSEKGKVPFICNYDSQGTPMPDSKKITTKSLLKKLTLSKDEIKYVISSKKNIYFRNGINVSDPKHRRYSFKVFYIVGLEQEQPYLEYIEKEWRKKFGQPKLCSYKSGR